MIIQGLVYKLIKSYILGLILHSPHLDNAFLRLQCIFRHPVHDPVGLKRDWRRRLFYVWVGGNEAGYSANCIVEVILVSSAKDSTASPSANILFTLLLIFHLKWVEHWHYFPTRYCWAPVWVEKAAYNMNRFNHVTLLPNTFVCIGADSRLQWCRWRRGLFAKNVISIFTLNDCDWRLWNS